MKTRIILLTAVLLTVSLAAAASETLLRNGKSRYVIAVGAQASASEQTAAKELQHYL